MSRGINKVILVGYVGQDPEIKYTPSGTAVANFSIATNYSWKNKQTGEVHEHTEWTRLVAFGRLAEIVGDYVRKGSQLYAEGSLRTSSWEDTNGVKRYKTEVVCDTVQMLNRKVDAPAGDFAVEDDDIPF